MLSALHLIIGQHHPFDPFLTSPRGTKSPWKPAMIKLQSKHNLWMKPSLDSRVPRILFKEKTFMKKIAWRCEKMQLNRRRIRILLLPLPNIYDLLFLRCFAGFKKLKMDNYQWIISSIEMVNN